MSSSTPGIDPVPTFTLDPPQLTSLSEFIYVSKLGRGADSSVFKYVKDGMFYTLKFTPRRAQNRDYEMEARILYGLNKLNLGIPKLYFGGQIHSQDRPPKLAPGMYNILILEYIEGHTLLQESLSTEVALKLARWLFGILSELHRINLIHGDIKLENILVTPAYEFYLIDFGLARIAPRQNQMGTPLYMAPEFLNGGVLTLKIDVWAAGITLFYVLHGEFPWDLNEEDNLEEQVTTFELFRRKVLHEALSRTHDHPLLAKVLRKSLCKDIHQRYSAIQIARLL